MTKFMTALYQGTWILAVRVSQHPSDTILRKSLNGKIITNVTTSPSTSHFSLNGVSKTILKIMFRSMSCESFSPLSCCSYHFPPWRICWLAGCRLSAFVAKEDKSSHKCQRGDTPFDMCLMHCVKACSLM